MKFFAELDIQNRIKPIYDSDYQTLKKVKKNTALRFEVVNERNWELHKKAFALMNLGFENQEKINNFDHYRSLATIRAGYYESYETGKGTYVVAKSLSFASMQQDEFEELFSRLLDVISKQLDSKPDEIRAEILGFY